MPSLLALLLRRVKSSVELFGLGFRFFVAYFFSEDGCWLWCGVFGSLCLWGARPKTTWFNAGKTLTLSVSSRLRSATGRKRTSSAKQVIDPTD